MDYYREIIEILKKRKLSKDDIARLKIKLCNKHRIKRIPTDIEILLHADQKELPRLKHLQTKPTRSISGVAVIAVMTKPFRCPHGKCIVCPGGPKSVFGNVPQSYTGKEPATMRGMRAGFDPYIQVFNRLEQYVVSGHNIDKIELIIMGGTFPSVPRKYQEDFVMNCFRAMNDFSGLFFRKNEIDIKKFRKFFELPGEVGSEKRTKSIQKKMLDVKKKSSLAKEQLKNEKSKVRCIGMTIETRPDYGKLKQGNEMLRLGCTRVEIGVQSVYDLPLKKINRGHTVSDSVESIKALKDLGFKINAHYMLGLLGVTKKQELDGLKELFANPDFQPDMLKIYPCMVMKGTKLYNEWKKGNYSPISTKDAAELIAEFKKDVPEYCRIMRVQRDIPTYMTEAGVDRTNLRQYVQKVACEMGIKCRCIRCREVGRAGLKGKASIRILPYIASGGTEFFISYETDNALLGFCRMRFPSKSMRKEITKNSALIRELHVYGEALAVGQKGKIQHTGIGRKLLKKAEQIAGQNNKGKMVVISGVGARDYYKKRGYRKQDCYMVKTI